MNKDTRDSIERATQRARNLLEEDFAAQLEGDFDVHKDGAVASKPGGHLSARQAFQRERIVAAIGHKRAAGMSAADAVADYLRDAAFTTLNRFVALKMLEARELVQECITKGEQSAGYREFCGLAPGLPLLPDGAGYRLYIESLFDELSTEVKVLFDRRDPSSVLWPKRATFELLLKILTAGELARLWSEDETIGWVYQFFNREEDRRAARYDEEGKPKAPQNSRELAVRNQFFTPRYVVQFLTDNTLGRIWYEMRDTRTMLYEKCEYMVRQSGEKLVPRAKKDPRDLRVLDPACGSGHFLLYAFDLLLAIYEEAYADADSPKSEATGKTLAEDHANLDALRKALPGLVLAHNLHGVDIDPRCAQIAQLALWMRAQKAYRDFGIGRAERAQIRRSNIVVAEPLIADDQIAKEFVAKLGDAELGRVFTSLVESLNQAGELGLLLRVEQLVGSRAKCGHTRDLFAPPEARIRAALTRFVSEGASRVSNQQRLFVDDALQGLGLLSLAEQGFDAILMNPPFGEMPRRLQSYADAHYPEGRNDIYAVFVRRAVELAGRAHGRVGALTSRAFVTGRDHRHFRRSLLAGSNGRLSLFADLGAGVLDGAMVETAAYVIANLPLEVDTVIRFIDARRCARESIADRLLDGQCMTWPPERFLQLPQSDLVYDLEEESFQRLTRGAEGIEQTIGRVTFGLTTKDDFRFVRLRWEVSSLGIAKTSDWMPFAKGGEYAWFTSTTHLLVKQGRGADEIATFAEQRDGNIASTRRSSSYYFKAAVCYSRRSQRGFSMRRLRPNACFSDKTAVIVPDTECSGWLYALPPALASSEYQRLIVAQSKFGSYEIGPVKTLPVPDVRLLGQKTRWECLYSYFDEIEAADETSETFCGLPPIGWTPAQGWNEALAALVEGLSNAELTLDSEVASQLDSWVAARSAKFSPDIARRSFAVGCAFGRFQSSKNDSPPLDPFAAPRPSNVVLSVRADFPDVLVDDYGSRDDIVERVHPFVPEVGLDELREWLRTTFWDVHLGMYSRSRRSAPIYWQLATPSASYSVWLYIHAYSKDTLFRVQNDYVGGERGKLAHEERRLESLTRELRDGATPVQRKELAAQESFVEELRAFLDEVKRVTPLWNPNLDDGVIINFAPLWRLVPQDKAWQKELKSTWDALCEGKYDWAHLALHLWPERVVPKCAKDRSLAIAHGLEEVFWVEGTDGKWTARRTPTRSVDELVRERTSPAVKSALKSLLDAPAATGKSTGRSGRRKAATLTEGGDA